MASICCCPPERLAAGFVEPLATESETRADSLDALRDVARRRACGGEGAEPQILAHGQAGEDLPALGHMRDAGSTRARGR